LYRDRDGITEGITRTGVERIMTQRDGAVPCVGGLAYDDEGRLLLVRRANEPGRGLWSIPGGRVEPGEDDAAALVREMREETGLHVAPGPLVGGVRRGRFAIADYRCTVVGGALRAGDDALDARFVDRAALASLPLVPELLVTLTAWDALPAR
jgi:ADP-ribose pyrophosphatase YjhB (NUDIX family)